MFGSTIVIPPKQASRQRAAKPPLYPSLATVSGALKLSITSGFSESTVPTFGGVSLSTDPAPSYTITAATKLWLKITWIPGSDSVDGVYWIESGGTISSAEFVVASTRPSETEPLVDEAGTITNGVFVFLWADIAASGSTFVIAARRSGNHQFTFCPGNSLKLLMG